MADGGQYLQIEKSRYLQNRLADFYEICMAMQISCFNPIGDQNFENPRLQTVIILKIEKKRDILYVLF